MRTIFIPPGGFAGWAQQTVATQASLSRSPATRRRKKTTRKKATRKKTTTRRRRAAPASRRRTTRRAKPARLVKGSAAAKRHMAKLRKMRKR